METRDDFLIKINKNEKKKTGEMTLIHMHTNQFGSFLLMCYRPGHIESIVITTSHCHLNYFDSQIVCALEWCCDDDDDDGSTPTKKGYIAM